MPTPGGLLKRGDRIRHVTSGKICVVLERLGTDCAYSVRIKMEDETVFQSTGRNERILTEAPYWLRNGWELVR